MGVVPDGSKDGDQLGQVFQNPLSNATKYSGDDGIDIDPAETERIFDVFQRLHSREEHEGTGIGLALCQRIVERHGDDIWVDSAPGEGATFSVTLPAADETGR